MISLNYILLQTIWIKEIIFHLIKININKFRGNLVTLLIK